ncbi:MAG: META domain-containing protein [Caldilineales bacterium]
MLTYTSDDQGNLTIDGPIGTTMMVCEEGGEQEMAYLAALGTVTGYTISEQGRLELTMTRPAV